MPVPRATIVVTTRNRPELARRALATALQQTVNDIEVIVVDDASDPPFEPAVDDDRVTLVRLDRQSGLSAARNAALVRARGGWITHLDDDDELAPNMVQVSHETALRSQLPPPVAVVSAVEHILHSTGRSEIWTPVSLPRGSHFLLDDSVEGRDFPPFPPNTLFVETEVLRSIGGWDQGLPAWEYEDLFLRLNPICSIQASDAVTYRLHAYAGPRLSQNHLAVARGKEMIVEKHRLLFLQHRAKFATYLRGIAFNYLVGGKRRAALGAALRATARDPAGYKNFASVLVALAGPTAYRKVRKVLSR